MKLWGKRKTFKQDPAAQQDCVLRLPNLLKRLGNSEKNLLHATSILGGRLGVHKALDQVFLIAGFTENCPSMYLGHCPGCDENEHN